eukprot:2346877-Amphidinium_carterae.1
MPMCEEASGRRVPVAPIVPCCSPTEAGSKAVLRLPLCCTKECALQCQMLVTMLPCQCVFATVVPRAALKGIAPLVILVFNSRHASPHDAGRKHHVTHSLCVCVDARAHSIASPCVKRQGYSQKLHSKQGYPDSPGYGGCLLCLGLESVPSTAELGSSGDSSESDSSDEEDDQLSPAFATEVLDPQPVSMAPMSLLLTWLCAARDSVPSALSMMSQDTILIFDWDDTVLPSTWIQEQGVAPRQLMP